MSYKPKYQEKGLQQLYDRFREKVKYRPIYMNYANLTMYDMPGGKNATDIYSFDKYVFGRGGHEVFRGEGWLKDMLFMQKISERDRKPFGNWIQCTAGYEWATFPNERQMLYQGYLSLIRGARLVSSFVFHLRPESEDSLNGFAKFSRECDKLEPVLLDGKTIDSVFADKKILVLAKQYKNKLYLLTLNPYQEKVFSKINLNVTGAANKAKVLFENRGITVKNSILSDVYQPLERHVYVIDMNN
jgi:hypothetical protein